MSFVEIHTPQHCTKNTQHYSHNENEIHAHNATTNIVIIHLPHKLIFGMKAGTQIRFHISKVDYEW